MSAAQSPYTPAAIARRTDCVRHFQIPPSYGAPATRRDDEYVGNRAVHTPGASSSSTPAHTSSPAAISAPLVSKQESTAAAGRLAATPASGLARMLAIHSSITANAIAVWSKAMAGRASVNQMTWLDASPSWLSRR